MTLTLDHPQGLGCTCEGPAPARFGGEIRRLILDAIQQFRSWGPRRRQRRDLADLDDRFLNDIGITRVAAQLEAAKPFWA